VSIPKTYAVILAGGKGTRLWPFSKKGFSKSFIPLADKAPMVLQTTDRLKGLVKADDILFVADKLQEKAVRKVVGKIRSCKVLVEPFGRSTASAVGLAAIEVKADDLLIVLPTDAFVDNEDRFRETLDKAASFVRDKDGVIMCLGIPPKEPATGYGYIKVGNRARKRIYAIDRFVEKPSKNKAKRLVKHGGYLWNSGIFLFKAKDILSAFKDHSSDLYRQLMRIKADRRTIRSAYSNMKNISIDYQIMEKAQNLYCIKANFVWRDLGNWVSIEKLFNRDRMGNLCLGNVRIMDSRNTSIYNTGRYPVGVIGTDNIVIVNTDHGTLVCGKKHVEKVNKLNLL